MVHHTLPAYLPCHYLILIPTFNSLFFLFTIFFFPSKFILSFLTSYYIYIRGPDQAKLGYIHPLISYTCCLNMHTRSRKNVRVEELSLPLGECISTFNLEKAVCNHGFFMMAPNRWVPSSKTLERPLRLADSATCVTVSIQHPPNHTSLLIQVYDHIHNLSFADKDAILQQVRRMLRISEKDERAIREYHEVHPEAKEKGYGRVFRSPTLFEDLVKCILLRNTK